MSPRERRRFRLVRVAAVAAAAPFVRAGAAGAAFVARVAAAERRGEPVYPDVPNPAPSLTLAAAVALDELVRLPMGMLASTASHAAYEEASSELDEAVRFYDANGWLDDPDGYFVTPAAPRDVAITSVGRRRGAHELLRFESGYEPHPDEPGRDRWLSFDANRDVHATMLRHPDGPRPWVVCVHGQGMGRHTDLEFFRLRRMHQELGVNVMLPVLPLHGPRREGRRPDQTFVSGVYPVNNALGLGQSVWDLRRILAWLRQHEGATRIGVYGFSLGSYVGSLLSTVDGDLACVVSVVPTGDLAEALRMSEPGLPSKRRAHRSLHDLRSALVHRVVSPVARPCQVPKDRRFIIAGQGDRIAVPTGAALLWRHWEEPAIEWRPRGHLTTARSAAYDDHLYAILQASGLAARDAVDVGGMPASRRSLSSP